MSLDYPTASLNSMASHQLCNQRSSLTPKHILVTISEEDLTSRTAPREGRQGKKGEAHGGT